MGLILDPRRSAIDASGNGLNAATLTVYEQGTTTLASVFSDAALSTPLVNPVVANSAGVFPAIYAAEGGVFDLILKNSAGTSLYTEDDIPAIGTDVGAITRDFTNSRMKIDGTGGEVSFEAGPAVGDDTGGAVRIGGWAGTQADTAEIDAAAISVTGTLAVTGNTTVGGTFDADGLITENSKKLPGVVYTETTPAAAADIVLTLPEAPANVRSYLIEGIDITMSAIALPTLTVSYDSGSTYKTGATDYAHSGQIITSAGGTTILVDDAATSGALTPAVNFQTPTAKPGRLKMTVMTVESGSNATLIEGVLIGYNDGGTDYPTRSEFVIYCLGGYGRVTNIKISVSSGTITGTFRIIPERGFGE